MADFDIYLSQLREEALLGGGDVRIQKQHQKGKGTARERINALLDTGSFQEIGIFATQTQEQNSNGKPTNYGDGVITGKGTIDGRPIYIFAQDFTVMGGSVGKVHGKKNSQYHGSGLPERCSTPRIK